MKTLFIILLTLMIYSAISTLVIILSNHNEKSILFFAFGIVGTTMAGIFALINFIHKYQECRYGKRSIFRNIDTGELVICRTSDAINVVSLKDYELVTLYANKSEWKDLPKIDDALLKQSRRNCIHCAHFDCCADNENIKCKHTSEGVIEEFNAFEKKRGWF